MAKKLSPKLKESFRPRIRHVHFPDLPPFYAPRALPGKLRDFLHSQIVQQRVIAKASAGNNEPDETSRDPEAALRAWLRQASPPPTIMSFTRRPSYVLPKHYMAGREAWEADYITANLRAQQEVIFPKPPNWSPLPFRPPSEANTEVMKMRHDPLTRRWEPGVMVLPCAEPMYFGPGQISIWPVMDLLDDLQRGKSIRTMYEYERILEDTTISVLKREYGLDAFAIPGKPGVWVESLIPPAELSEVVSLGINLFEPKKTPKYQNVRRIATVHADFVDNITRHGVSIHVGQPGTDIDRFGDSPINPWAAIRQDTSTTSIVAELALKGSVPRRSDSKQQEIEHRSDKKSLYLQTAFDESSPYISKPLRAMPYSLVSLQPGLRLSTPMGLDNRDLSTAWAHEFARQLGLMNGIVDHLSMTNFPADVTSLPEKSRSIGLMSRPVSGEDQLKEPYEQVEVPTIQLTEGGLVTKMILKETHRCETNDERIPRDASPDSWALSWPLYYHNVTSFLTKTIGGLPRDTRLTQFLRSQKVETIIDRRWLAIQEAGVLRDAWHIYQTPRGQDKKQPFLEGLVAECLKLSKDMQDLLYTLQAGRINIPRKKLLAKAEEIQFLLKSQKLHATDDSVHSATADGSEGPADMSHGPIDSSLPTQRFDEILQETEKIPEIYQNHAIQLKQKLSEPHRSGQDRIRFTPTRAERRRDPAKAAERIERVRLAKSAKPGPFKPKPLS